MREAAATGFYPGDKKLLKEIMNKLITSRKPEKITGCIVPHAGYLYSGSVAASVYSILDTSYDSIIIFGPDHTGIAKDASVSSQDWELPCGTAHLDYELASDIEMNSDRITVDNLAHMYEHSIEVQLPFLYKIFKDFKFVPIIIPSHYTSPEIFSEIASAIKKACKNKKVLFIASSDFTHFGSGYNFVPVKENQFEWIKETDNRLIRAITSSDKDTALKLGKQTTCCGIGPIMILMNLVSDGELIKYDTSYSISKNKNAIVGYSGIVFRK